MSVADPPQGSAAHLDLDGIRMLVVDDDDVIRSLFVAMFPQVATVAAGPAEALRMLEQQEFDLIVTDYCMPGLNGAELIREIKRRRPDVPIVVMTGFGRQFGMSEAKLAGAADYIMKPFRQRELIGRLRAALDAHGLRVTADRHQRVLDQLREILDQADLAPAEAVRQMRGVIRRAGENSPQDALSA